MICITGNDENNVFFSVCGLQYVKTKYIVSLSFAYFFFPNSSSKSQVYELMFGSQKVSVYCHIENFGCGDGGWTLAMKIDGTKVTSRLALYM